MNGYKGIVLFQNVFAILYKHIYSCFLNEILKFNKNDNINKSKAVYRNQTDKRYYKYK